jgi:hypothetical protein
MAIGGRLRSRGAVLLLVAGAVLLPPLALLYKEASAASYTTDFRIVMRTLESTAHDAPLLLAPVTLEQYARDLQSRRVTRGAARRLDPKQVPGPQLDRAAAELARTVTVAIDRRRGEIVLKVRASSQERAARVANAYARSFMQLRRVAAVDEMNMQIAAVKRRLAARPRSGAARRAALASLRRALTPVVGEEELQLVHSQPPSRRPLVTVAIAAAIVLLAGAVALALTGGWRPRGAAT